MRTILLCAGFATRMYPLTKDFPKPLLEVAGKPVLDYLLDQLIDLPDLREIHLVSNARFARHFEAWQADWRERLVAHNKTLTVHDDGTTDNENRLGAVADLAFVLDRLPDLQPTMITAGDNIFRFALAPIWQDFRENGQNYVLALRETRIERLRRTGVLELAENDQVMKLHEKPQAPPSEWTAPAFYCLHPAALRHVSDYLSQPNAQDAPGHFIAYLVEREPVFAAKIAGTRFDIGSMQSYREANQILQSEPAIVT
ncbi:MAG: nucleotidyltransferase family protein [Deferribacteres bacterium]|nr:nucleotidyltransferase family protein [candidate division KSB1 bacterium]MCB9508979.1 nucleotidyltransferase family protein [Deferribacteres bacterium]